MRPLHLEHRGPPVLECRHRSGWTQQVHLVRQQLHADRSDIGLHLGHDHLRRHSALLVRPSEPIQTPPTTEETRAMPVDAIRIAPDEEIVELPVWIGDHHIERGTLDGSDDIPEAPLECSDRADDRLIARQWDVDHRPDEPSRVHTASISPRPHDQQEPSDLLSYPDRPLPFEYGVPSHGQTPFAV